MKILITVASIAFLSTSAFADIDAICNVSGGYTMEQKEQGLPRTIIAKLVTSDQISKSTLSIELDGLVVVKDVEFNTPDENIVSAEFTITQKNKPVKQEVLFYVGGSNQAEIFKVNSRGYAVKGSLTRYTCGMYDDGNYKN